MVAFEWTSDVWAPAAIALLGTVIGVLVAVYFARRAAIRAVADDRELQLELVRLGRERDAIDGLDTAILILRDVVSNWAMSLADETTSATPGTQAVKDEFFRFTRTAESLYVRLRPELRSVIVPFAQATEVGWLSQGRGRDAGHHQTDHGSGRPTSGQGIGQCEEQGTRATRPHLQDARRTQEGCRFVRPYNDQPPELVPTPGGG